MSSEVGGAELVELVAGQKIPFGGDRYMEVDADLAREFRRGDRLIVVQETGLLIHVPEAVSRLVARAVASATESALGVANASASAVGEFFESFARRLETDSDFADVMSANENDVADARRRGRSTGRLELTGKMRSDMAAASRMWRDFDLTSSHVVSRVDHGSWMVEERRAPLGVVGFVFEGRPNVFADATGVLRTGNTVVFRIGSDALRTARAIMDRLVIPALEESGLPAGAVVLVDSPERSAGHALFSDRRLSLAVARGSGEAVAQLGAVARQSGIPVSLHGTGGAWILIDRGAESSRVGAIIDASLDRKVCNTANVISVPRGDEELLVSVLDGLARAGARRRHKVIVHCRDDQRTVFGNLSAGDLCSFDVTTHSDDSFLSTEWEWDADPEVSIVFADDIDHGVELFNRFSPQFVISVISPDPSVVDHVFDVANSPFVGDGFTRWVDGQYALGRPELGLSNWQNGRLFGRGGILSGDGVFSVRYLARHSDEHQRR